MYRNRNKIHMQPPERNFSGDCDLKRDLKSGDIILYRFVGKNDISGGVISHLTSSPYSHAEIHIKDGYTIAATSNGLSFRDLLKYNIKQYKPSLGPSKKGQTLNVDLFRFKSGLSREQRLIIEAKALETLAMPYDYLNLFTFPFLSGKQALRKSGNDAYICSEHVAWCYKNAGIDLIEDKPEAIEAPADLGYSEKLTYIGTYVEGKKIESNYKNKLMNQEYSLLQKFISSLMGLFSKKDEFYKGLKDNKAVMGGI
jgi:hypothetical protein